MMTNNKNEERIINPPMKNLMKRMANGIAVRERLPINGTEAETPLVFIHGSGFESSIFDQQFESDILAHQHLIAMDLPGHGQSDDARDPQTDYSYAQMGEKLLEALELMGFQSAILVGWSLGGQIAIEMNNDDRVKGVFAFGVAPIAPGPMGLIRGFHFSLSLLLASKAQHTLADAQKFEAACFGQNAKGRFLDAIMRTDPAMRPSMSKLVLKGIGMDQRDAVENPTKPICLVNGGKDPFIRTEYLRGLDSLGLYTKEVIIIEECGHAPFMDAPEIFDVILSDFADWVEINAFAFDRALTNVAIAA